MTPSQPSPNPRQPRPTGLSQASWLLATLAFVLATLILPGCGNYIGSTSEQTPLPDAASGRDTAAETINDSTAQPPEPTGPEPTGPEPPPCPCINGKQVSCAVPKAQGPCAIGIKTCTGCAWSACEPSTKPIPEDCSDGVDNDCNGKVDDCIGCTNGTTQSCYTGPAGTAGKGLCKNGTQTCAKGAWGPCIGAVIPKQELCEGKEDEDCDGQIDENCPPLCKSGEARKCYTGPAGTADKGVCKAGTQTCLASAWGPCTGQVLPTMETCNKKDDDCNGQVDEGACSGCNDGDARICYTGPASTQGKGECKSGTQKCQGGAWGPCAGQVLPTSETCDQKDNDCDGLVDEGFNCCVAGQSKPCYTGPAGTAGKGVCKNGTQTCDATGKWSMCVGEVLPTAETCDGKDNDCDGAVDETFPGKGSICSVAGQKGICATGTPTCTNGTQSCVGKKPATEVCDSFDNDCDGTVDEGNVCVPPAQGHSFRINSFAIASSSEGFDLNGDGTIDNSLSSLGTFVNSTLSQAVSSGGLNVLLELTQLSDPKGQSGTGTVYLYMGTPAANGAYNIQPSSLDAQGRPLFRFAGTINNSLVKAGPGLATLLLPLFGPTPTQFTMRQAYIQFVNVNLTSLDKGLLGGAVPAANLDKIPADQIPFLGGPGKTLLDVVVQLGKQPDIDLDGDGLERFTLSSGEVTSCTDGNKQTISSKTCAQDSKIADGYSVTFNFTATKASVNKPAP